MAKCKTIALLERLAAEQGDLSAVAASALSIVEDINESGMAASSIQYLHTLVDEIFKAGDVSLLDHLHAGPDCQLCREMAKRMQSISAA